MARDHPRDGTVALGRVIEAQKTAIEHRWLERVQQDVAGRSDVSLTHLRDGIPDYLAALARYLQREADAEPSGTEIWSRVAREHGIARVQLGFDIDQLIREFSALRQEIRAATVESGEWTATTEACLGDLIDSAVAESVRAYVEARDNEIRRVQAEHIGFITHELRNPLASAMTAAALLRAETSTDRTRLLDMLDRGHRRLLDLVDSVLHAEKMQASPVQARAVDVAERELLEPATDAAREAARRKGLTFEVHGDPDRRVHADPDLTRSAIQNLVDNAVKYTDRGRVEVVVEADETSWCVHVRDTGPGVSAEELSTIFEPFHRGTTDKKGTGLGLSIARRAVEAQGGSIHAESPGPVGSHFWIRLPKQRR